MESKGCPSALQDDVHQLSHTGQGQSISEEEHSEHRMESHRAEGVEDMAE